MWSRHIRHITIILCITPFLRVPISAPFPACTHPGDGILADPMEAELAEVEGQGVGLGAPLHDEVGDLWKLGVGKVGEGMAPALSPKARLPYPRVIPTSWQWQAAAT